MKSLFKLTKGADQTLDRCIEELTYSLSDSGTFGAGSTLDSDIWLSNTHLLVINTKQIAGEKTTHLCAETLGRHQACKLIKFSTVANTKDYSTCKNSDIKINEQYLRTQYITGDSNESRKVYFKKWISSSVDTNCKILGYLASTNENTIVQPKVDGESYKRILE